MPQVILLEKIDKLGEMGDTVNVKPGFARNYLLPQNKALRATDSNKAYFESQKASLQKANDEKRKDAEKRAKKLEGLSVAMIRQASESGQLYGSVTSRDIAEAIGEEAKEKIERYMVDLNQSFKTIGLFPVEIALHPEVKVEVTINIARTQDEAAVQAKTGKALITDDNTAQAAPQETADMRSELMEESALEAEKAREAEEEAEAAKAAAEAEEKAAERAAKKAAKAAEEAAESSDEEENPEAQAAEEDSEDEKKD